MTDYTEPASENFGLWTIDVVKIKAYPIKEVGNWEVVAMTLNSKETQMAATYCERINGNYSFEIHLFEISSKETYFQNTCIFTSFYRVGHQPQDRKKKLIKEWNKNSNGTSSSTESSAAASAAAAAAAATRGKVLLYPMRLSNEVFEDLIPEDPHEF